MTKPRIVVVGGGYAGATVARELDEVADVTLVEPKDHFVHASGTLRSTVDASWDKHVFHSLDNLLINGRIVQDSARLVTPERVMFTATSSIDADYIVLATGTSYPFPAKFIEERAWVARSRLDRQREALAQASGVLIVGAGPVGIELAGELVHAFPGLKVTIVDRNTEILHAEEYTPELREELMRQLGLAGVEFVLGEVLGYMPPVDVGVFEDFKVATSAGTEISAQIWFRAYGNKQESDYLDAQFGAARRHDGRIRVEPTMQVVGFDNVFAVGDVNDVAETKRAHTAMVQARVAAKNIKAMIQGQEPTFRYMPRPGRIILPLGPTGGASQIELPDGSHKVVGAHETAELKGHDLMAGPIVRLLRNEESAA